MWISEKSELNYSDSVINVDSWGENRDYIKKKLNILKEKLSEQNKEVIRPIKSEPIDVLKWDKSNVLWEKISTQDKEPLKLDDLETQYNDIKKDFQTVIKIENKTPKVFIRLKQNINQNITELDAYKQSITNTDTDYDTINRLIENYQWLKRVFLIYEGNYTKIDSYCREFNINVDTHFLREINEWFHLKISINVWTWEEQEYDIINDPQVNKIAKIFLMNISTYNYGEKKENIYEKIRFCIKNFNQDQLTVLIKLQEAWFNDRIDYSRDWEKFKDKIVTLSLNSEKVNSIITIVSLFDLKFDFNLLSDLDKLSPSDVVYFQNNKQDIKNLYTRFNIELNTENISYLFNKKPDFKNWGPEICEHDFNEIKSNFVDENWDIDEIRAAQIIQFVKDIGFIIKDLYHLVIINSILSNVSEGQSKKIEGMFKNGSTSGYEKFQLLTKIEKLVLDKDKKANFLDNYSDQKLQNDITKFTTLYVIKIPTLQVLDIATDPDEREIFYSLLEINTSTWIVTIIDNYSLNSEDSRFLFDVVWFDDLKQILEIYQKPENKLLKNFLNIPEALKFAQQKDNNNIYKYRSYGFKNAVKNMFHDFINHDKLELWKVLKNDYGVSMWNEETLKYIKKLESTWFLEDTKKTETVERFQKLKKTLGVEISNPSEFLNFLMLNNDKEYYDQLISKDFIDFIVDFKKKSW
jgi:hypothetical protein